MRRSPAQPKLSRESILDAALVLIERDGLDALSMRRLAAELDAGTMSLYVYFADKAELLDALVDWVAAVAPLPELHGPWRDRLTAVMTHMYEALSAHPAIARLRVSQPIATPGAFRFTEAALSALRDAGFDAATAARHFRTLFLFTFGVAVFGAPASPEQRGRAAGALAMLPRDEYPTLTGQLGEMLESLDSPVQFEHGLAVLLDGVEASAPARSR
ncbi:MAG TPA: TetR/AcrR family transcriptional regulator C-terminal domain-containing protein [Thermoleophilaceae bacterium]|nr:TetR/AcrR family transcriptional regulator C-terminal domain-containing protein [Thermoleophilaceae bacterium]